MIGTGAKGEGVPGNIENFHDHGEVWPRCAASWLCVLPPAGLALDTTERLRLYTSAVSWPIRGQLLPAAPAPSVAL